MKILVTGGLGYVGGRVSAALADAGIFEVMIASRRNQASVSDSSSLNKCSLRKLDVMFPDLCRSACRGVDAVVHLAAVNEIESLIDPVKAMQINAIGSLNILSAAIEEKVSSFVYFSTAHIYGSPLSGVIDESTLPRPIHPYAISHRVAEDFVLASRDKREINGIVVRLSNSVGFQESPDADRWTLLANDLCRQAVLNKKIMLCSSGAQARDFIPLSDVTKAVQHLLALPKESVDDGLFNLGSGKSMSVLNMAELISRRAEKLLGEKIEIERPQSTGDNSCPLFEYKVDKLLRTGFSLKGSIEKEIDATILYCMEEAGRE